MLKIKELHNDIERYLKEDCYCPNEIYSFDRFCYQEFYPNQDCEELEHQPNSELIGCVAHPFNKEDVKPQVVIFFLEDNGKRVYDALRYDATENNLKITKDILMNGVNGRKFHFDEYEKGSTAKTLSEILSIADAVIID